MTDPDRLRPGEPAVFQRRRLITERDVDELGHVNNLVWLRFALELATAHSAAVGWDFQRYRQAGVLWIVHRHEIDYHRPALPGDELIEATWIEGMRGARCLRATRFSRAGEILVEARTTWVFADAATQRPRRIAPELLEAFPTLGPARIAAKAPKTG